MKAAKGTEGVVLSLPQSGQRAVSLPTASLKKAAEGELSLTLKLTNATLRLDSKALEALASPRPAERRWSCDTGSFPTGL